MLVLLRRTGEKIIIDGDIQITVLAVQGKSVRIGVTAPTTVLVDRQEVNDRRQEWTEKPWGQRSALGKYRTPELSRAN